MLSRAARKLVRGLTSITRRTLPVPPLPLAATPQHRPSCEEIIRFGYLLFLGREAESELVVRQKAEQFTTIEEIRRDFMSSEEFKMKYGLLSSSIEEAYRSPPAAVETVVSEEMLEKLFSRIRRQWEKLGATDPFWSVISSDAFKGENFKRHAQEFYDSGRGTASLVDIFANRNKVVIPRGTCLELGCGVGRATVFLAERFERVIAVDISEGNLSHCRDYMEKNGVENVETVLLKAPRDVTELQQFDFLFSTIVLQHNPPPVQRFMLDRLLAKIPDGGSCLFQLPTHMPGYEFVSTEYLTTEYPSSEMHCLPMHVVFHLMKAHSFTPHEVLLDGWIGGYGSHTFFATKTK